MAFFLFVVAVGFLVFRVTKPEDRDRVRQSVILKAAHIKAIAMRPRPEIERFESALKGRTERLLVTPVLVALFVAALVLRWDGSVGPRTTNGEWWRLLTASFVHTGIVQLAIHGAALYQIASTIERLAGRATLAIVFFASGILAIVVSTAVQPVAIVAGSAGAIFGLYGLFIAAVVLSRRRAAMDASLAEADSPIDDADTVRIAIPALAIRRIAMIALVLWLTNAIGGTVPFAAELAALALGITAGLVLLRGVSEGTPEAPHLAATAAAALIVVCVLAWPLRGIADVRPEIARVLATEERTASAFASAMESVKKGKTTMDGVARLIDATITPELEAVDARIKALKKVPPEHQPLVNDAEEFLRLRSESWRLRSASLRTTHRTPPRKRPVDADSASDANWRMRLEAQFRSDRTAIGKAEAVERTSLELLARLRTSD